MENPKTPSELRFEQREVIRPAPGPIETIILPYHEFRKADSACHALMKLSEQQMKDGVDIPVSVPAIRVNGILVTGAGGSFRGLDSQINAWELTPEVIYQGPTTPRYHDEKAIKAGLRRRDDLTGLIVTYRGSRMVLSRRIALKAGAPLLRYAVSLADAKKFDAGSGQGAWRDLSGDPVRWVEKEGFVFAVFPPKHGQELTMLYIRTENGHVQNISVKDIDSFVGPSGNTGSIDAPKQPPKTKQRPRKSVEEDKVMMKLIEALRALA